MKCKLLPQKLTLLTATLLARQAKEARTELDIAEEELRMCERFLPTELIATWRAAFPATAYVDGSGELVSRFRSTGNRGT